AAGPWGGTVIVRATSVLFVGSDSEVTRKRAASRCAKTRTPSRSSRTSSRTPSSRGMRRTGGWLTASQPGTSAGWTTNPSTTEEPLNTRSGTVAGTPGVSVASVVAGWTLGTSTTRGVGGSGATGAGPAPAWPEVVGDGAADPPTVVAA